MWQIFNDLFVTTNKNELILITREKLIKVNNVSAFVEVLTVSTEYFNLYRNIKIHWISLGVNNFILPARCWAPKRKSHKKVVI